MPTLGRSQFVLVDFVGASSMAIAIRQTGSAMILLYRLWP
jgi:hypothetical protein